MLMWTADDLHGYNGRRLPEEMDDWIYQIAQGMSRLFIGCMRRPEALFMVLCSLL